MKVSELILALQRMMPELQDTEVLIESSNGEYDPCPIGSVERVTMAPRVIKPTGATPAGTSSDETRLVVLLAN